MAHFYSPDMQPSCSAPRSISTRRYMPFCFDGIHGFPNAIPFHIRKHLPKFNVNHGVLASHHIQLFCDLMGDYEIADEDVHMKLFVQTLEGDARDWFAFLPECSISSWGELHMAFMQQFGKRVSLSDSFGKFLRIHIRNGELVPEFNVRFARAINEIPENYRSSDQVCLVAYLDAFDKGMSYLLRDKEP